MNSTHRASHRRTRFLGQTGRQGEFATRLVVLPTVDGHHWDGILYLPRRGDPRRRRLGVLVVHGSVGNYLSGLPRRISFALARAGFTVLSVNTRMANFGPMFGEGLLHRTPLDLDPALELLRRTGHRRIVMVGFSMGATMVTHYQSVRAAPEVAGVLTLAHPRSLPEALRHRWERFGARPDYDQVADRARRALAPDFEDRANDRIFVVQRGAGPTERPEHAEIWTHRTWWFSRGPDAPHAVSEGQVGTLRVPLGLIQAGADPLVPERDGETLRAAALAGGCPAVDLAVIDGASHTFDGHDDALAATCVRWLEERVLTPGTAGGAPGSGAADGPRG